MRIDYLQVPISPIESFSDVIFESLDDIIYDAIEYELKQTKIDLDEIRFFTNEINSKRQQIIVEKKAKKITKRWIANSFIGISFLLIVGFFFISTFKRNMAIIKEFRNYRNNEQKIILTFQTRRSEMLRSILSTTGVQDIIVNVLNKFGIKSSNYFATSEIENVLKKRYRNFLDLHSGIKGIVKNSPFYYVIVREHVIRNVVTSNTMSFPYQKYDRYSDEYYTEYENLTAYHSEPTPFIDHYCELIYKTNFLPELHLTSNNESYDKKILLENKEFIRYYRINDISNNAVQTKEFFTIKTQEDFVNWYKKQNGEVYPFEKYLNAFIVRKGSNGIGHLNSSTFFCDLKNYYQDLDLTTVVVNTLTYLKTYFSGLFKMLQLPLLVPGISREWYQENGNYLIAGNFNSNITKLNDNITNGLKNILMNFVNNGWLEFDRVKKVCRPAWVSLETVGKLLTPSVISTPFRINSYTSKTKIDYVTVYGKNVGAKIIPVPYEKFYDINETKVFVFLPTLNDTDNCLVYGKKLLGSIYKDVYGDKTLADIVYECKIWTNNPLWLENLSKRNELIDLIRRVKKLDEDFRLNLLFQIDKIGLCAVVGNLQNYSNEVENKLIQIMETIGSGEFLSL